MDYALHKKVKLYVAFIDFSKAYDRVPRNRLIGQLKSLGCGGVMLRALSKVYANTQQVLGSATITASIGVRQGSPTSCSLFTLYVNELILSLKEQCGHDGFLGQVHCLMLMDDTVIMSTSREKCIEKLGVLMQYCSDSGMVINSKKTKFMVINGADRDKEPIVLRDITIENCDQYTYLGAVFRQDGKTSSAINAHCQAKASQVLKFQSFMCNT